MASATRSRAVAVSAHVSDIPRWSPLLRMGAITSHARVETRAAMLSFGSLGIACCGWTPRL